MVTCDRRRSLGTRPSRGDPLLLVEERLDSLAAFVTAAAARDIEEFRGEGVSGRVGGWLAACMERGCIGEEEVDLEGGREFKSGGAMKEQWLLRMRQRQEGYQNNARFTGLVRCF